MIHADTDNAHRCLTSSIAMATFNGGRYIEDQLRSLLEQSVMPSEIVISDDLSDDDTVDRIRAVSRDLAAPIKLHRNAQRLGYKANFMKAASLCTSDIIFFCDQDDVWEKDKIKVVLNTFSFDPDIMLVYHDAALTTSDGERFGSLLSNHPPLRFSGGDVPPWHFALGFTQAFRKELCAFDHLWNEIRTKLWPDSRNEPYAHDQWYMWLALAMGEIAFIPSELVRYRQHENNVYGAIPASSLINTIRRRLSKNSYNTNEAFAADIQCILLDGLANMSLSNHRERIVKHANRYRLLAERLKRRNETIDGSTLGRRLVSLVKAVRSGDYGPRQEWQFGPKSLAKDLVLGVVRQNR